MPVSAGSGGLRAGLIAVVVVGIASVVCGSQNGEYPFLKTCYLRRENDL